MQINEKIRSYVETSIFPIYANNDGGHNLEHIKYVIDRSFKFASTVSGINHDMVYVIAAYHDIGHHIDAKNHERISAEILEQDVNLRDFFSEEQISIMRDAVYDHRASLEYEPRSIYGKIVSSADRNVTIEQPLRRTYEYRVKNFPNSSFEMIVEDSRQHLLEKFGKCGYATEKMYFEDEDYRQFLIDIVALAENKEEFKRQFVKANKKQ